MDRVGTYAILAEELNRWRALPRSEVIDRVGALPVIRSALIDGEDVSVEVSAHWADEHRVKLRVEAVAYGPSHWNTERHVEAITLDSFADCIPKNKHDLEAVARAKGIGFPTLNKIFPQLLEWIQDISWPVAGPVCALLSLTGPENTSHIRAVLNSADDVWKYYLLTDLIPGLRRDVQEGLLDVVQRIACEPSEGERREEVALVAKEFLAVTNDLRPKTP